MRVITASEAQALYETLPPHKRIATLSPLYVVADSKRDAGLKPTFLLYQRRSQFWMHSVHQGGVPNSDFSDFQSPYGYGGPISFTDDPRFIVEANEAYFKWASENNIVAEFVRHHPMLGNKYHLGESQFNRLTVYLPPDARFSETCRNKIKKCAVEVGSYACTIFAHDALRRMMPEFIREYRRGMERLNAEKFYFFSDEYFNAIADLPFAELVVVGRGDVWLACALIFEGGTSFEYHLSVTNEFGRKVGATNYLISEIHRMGAARGKGLYLGGGKTQRSNDDLLAFKSSFGGELRNFYIGSNVFKPDVYSAMLDEVEVSPVNPKTLFWR